MAAYNILIFLSLALLLSYVYDKIARWLRVPSVLLLLSTGMALRFYADALPIQLPSSQLLVEIFGIVGLILIVLEGTLDLQLNAAMYPVLRRAAGSALFVLLLNIAVLTGVVILFIDAPWQMALVSVTPLAIISSAIAIPSASNLAANKREFVIIESSMSDIFGILLFTLFTQPQLASWATALGFVSDVALTTILSAVSCLALIYILQRSRRRVNFLLIVASLLLLYALAKQWHLPSLILIMSFGLMLNNYPLLLRGPLQRWLDGAVLANALSYFKGFTAEAAFMIRTFFFLLFGYSILVTDLLAPTALQWAGVFVLLMLVLRGIYLRFFAHMNLWPELVMSPKGLITILLFYSIPPALHLPLIDQSLLLLVILLSNLLMTLGLLLTRRSVQAYEDELH